MKRNTVFYVLMLIVFGLCSAQAEPAKPVPEGGRVCHWPETIPLNVTVEQAQVIQQIISNDHFDGRVFMTLRDQLEPQLRALTEKYCPVQSNKK